MPKCKTERLEPVYVCVYEILQSISRLPEQCGCPWDLFSLTAVTFCGGDDKERLRTLLGTRPNLGFVPIAVEGVAFCALKRIVLRKLEEHCPAKALLLVFDGLCVNQGQFLFSNQAQTSLSVVRANRGKIAENWNIVYNEKGQTDARTEFPLSRLYTAIAQTHINVSDLNVRLRVDVPVKAISRNKHSSSEGEEEETEEALNKQGMEEEEAVREQEGDDDFTAQLAKDIVQSMKALHEKSPHALVGCLRRGFELLDDARKQDFCQELVHIATRDEKMRGKKGKPGTPVQPALPPATMACGPGTSSVHQTHAPDPARPVWWDPLRSVPQTGPGLVARAPQCPPDLQGIVACLHGLRTKAPHLVGAYDPLPRNSLMVPPHTLSILKNHGLSHNIFHQLMSLFDDETLVAYLVLVTIDVVMSRRNLSLVSDAMPDVKARVEQWISLTRTPFGLLHVGLNVQFGVQVGAVDLAVSAWIECNQKLAPQLRKTFDALCEILTPSDHETMTTAECMFLKVFLLAVVANDICPVCIIPAHVMAARVSQKGFLPPKPDAPFVLVSFTFDKELTVPPKKPLPFLPEYAGMASELCKPTGDGGQNFDVRPLFDRIRDVIQRQAKEEEAFKQHEAEVARERKAREQERIARATQLVQERIARGEDIFSGPVAQADTRVCKRARQECTSVVQETQSAVSSLTKSDTCARQREKSTRRSPAQDAEPKVSKEASSSKTISPAAQIHQATRIGNILPTSARRAAATKSVDYRV